ncbi:DegT/DnrJ/EryC1/StrS family aminotransferase [Sandaracinobacter sp. RS1-74]|uniref:DegT/DnrJ/EryC1/StrS family aminotransferase n=1 Tax=Sandaracinobacteroides sayramensis TaxID=2913411 RepID=UPI001EDA9020|nr:DegT/DnrJ/EryC1/StrS family aminotransferase [Sandaracinobacteroides sayramensis]MCG2841182.1 DegT/DnrJ/EryC1/StrS family aminotransferase [Sandaracinobacteroides sayramensis]
MYSLFGVYHDEALERVAVEVLRSGQIASGPYVERFRAAFAEMVGNPHTVTVNDMSNAMVIAMRLAGVTRDCEVITSPFSCLSTNAPLGLSGATIRWADIDPETGSLSVDSVERLINARTRAVVLYHVAGYPGPACELAHLCRERGIVLIEDCDNALGATLDGTQLGQFGDYAVYSFYPNRQINAIDGGALSVRTEDEFDRAMRLRKYGIDPLRFRDRLGEIDPEIDVPELGWAALLSNLSSAIGWVQMEGVPGRLAATRANAERLRGHLRGVPGLKLVEPIAGGDPAWWAVLARSENSEALLRQLKASGVNASRLHYRNDGYSGFRAIASEVPGVDRFMAEVVALPCGWWLAPEQIDRIADIVKAAIPVPA